MSTTPDPAAAVKATAKQRVMIGAVAGAVIVLAALLAAGIPLILVLTLAAIAGVAVWHALKACQASSRLLGALIIMSAWAALFSVFVLASENRDFWGTSSPAAKNSMLLFFLIVGAYGAYKGPDLFPAVTKEH